MIHQNPGILSQIHETLTSYDPDGRSVLIGGAALAYHLNNLGWNTTHNAPDVDVLMGVTDIESLASMHQQARYKRQSLHEDNSSHGSATSERASLTIPEEDAAMRFSAYSGFNDDLFRIQYADAAEFAETFDNHPVLPLETVLRWKASVGRDKDSRDVTQAMKLDGIRSKLTPLSRHRISLALTSSAGQLARLRPTSRYDAAVFGDDYHQ